MAGGFDCDCLSVPLWLRSAAKGGFQMNHQNNQQTKLKEYITPKLITYGNLLEITGFAAIKTGRPDGGTESHMKASLIS